MHAPSPIHELLADPQPAGRALDELAENLLARLATEPAAGRPVALGELTDPQAQKRFRSLLACLARKSAQEAGTEFDPYGGTLAFVRPAPTGSVRLTGSFENRPTAARVTFHSPEPCPTPHASGARGAANTLADVLTPAVIDYWLDDTGFALASDLIRLDRVRAAGAAESAVMYCNRIVEAMARDIVGPGVDSPTPSLAGLITALDKYHDLRGPLKRLLHLLRSLGNDARHAIQPVSADDVDVAFVILLRWLQWAFCEFADGPKLKEINRPNRPTDSLLPQGLYKLVNDAAASGEEILDELTRASATDGGALLTPLLVAAAAEALISRDRLEQARTILEIGLRRSPRDRRLRQLIGLYWSRRGGAEKSAAHLHRARHELEPLLPQNGGVATDEETFGILAGVYKRLSVLEPNAAHAWLLKSRDTYRAGWEQSRRTNDYLGINAATLSLWLDSGAAAVAEVAGPIRNVFASLQTRLRTGGGALTYWDQVTWAEAELLLGEWDSAGELYRDAFARFSSCTADIGVSAQQARRILEKLGESARAADLLGPLAR